MSIEETETQEMRGTLAQVYLHLTPKFREKQRGGETQGRGKHTINPLPKNGFGPPHL